MNSEGRKFISVKSNWKTSNKILCPNLICTTPVEKQGQEESRATTDLFLCKEEFVIINKSLKTID